MNRSSTSPFRATGSRTGGSDSLDVLIRNLEQENISLVQEVGILKAKGKKMSELEDKIDMILRHNTQLLNENERLAKLINQKKSQVDIWKSKHDSLTANKNNAADLQVKRLLNEIEKLKQESGEIEHGKNLQINEIKNQQHLQIQNMKRVNLGHIEKCQLEIRKLKQYCDKKDYEISDLKMKIARISKETDFEIGKLRQERDRFKSEFVFEEAEHRKEVESLKNKFDYNFHSQIENIKKQHLNQIETLDYENTKLKQVINSKNFELDQTQNKHSKVRNHLEDTIELLKKEILELRDKLVENEQISDIELNNLREKLQNIKDSELTLLKEASLNEADILNREIQKLRKFLESRGEQIENISKERNQMRQALQGELLKAKAALETQINENRVLASRHENDIRVCNENLKYKNEEMKAMQSALISQIRTLQSENETKDALLQSKDKELGRERKETNQTLTLLRTEIQVIREQNNQARDEIERTANRANNDSKDQKELFEAKLKQLQTKVVGLEEEGKQKDNLIEQLKGNIKELEREVKLNDQKIDLLQVSERELRSQGKDNFGRWDAKQKELNKLIREQIDGMERSKKNEIQELKSIHDNKIRSLQHIVKELERQVEDKNRSLNSLKSKYEELVNNFEKVFAQEAARKNLDIKVPGWMPEILATKSVFDVFLKNKVLEYCS